MKVALVHDWLTGMRGGERVLEDVAHHDVERQRVAENVELGSDLTRDAAAAQ